MAAASARTGRSEPGPSASWSRITVAVAGASLPCGANRSIVTGRPSHRIVSLVTTGWGGWVMASGRSRRFAALALAGTTLLAMTAGRDARAQDARAQDAKAQDAKA